MRARDEPAPAPGPEEVGKRNHVAPRPNRPTVHGAGNAAVQRGLTTAGGTWWTAEHEARNDGRGLGKKVGAHIELHFTANDEVEAGKIGLTQTVKALTNTEDDDKVRTPRSSRDQPDYLVRGEGDVGRGIDRTNYAEDGGTLPNTNPMFGVFNVPATRGHRAVVSTSLGDIESTQREDATGSHRRGRPAEDAVLDDTPGRFITFAGQQHSMSFETTALAIDGPLSGTYLGSIAWGWRSEADGVSRLDPPKITVVREGPPSKQFTDAARKWNGLTFEDTDTGRDYATVDLPLVADVARLTTPRLADRLADLRADDSPTARDDFQRIVLERELAKRHLEISIKVRKTEDLGDDEVYAKITGDLKHRTKSRDMGDGDLEEFLIPLSLLTKVLPLTKTLTIEVYDEDSVHDDRIVTMTWSPDQGVAHSGRSSGGDYEVAVEFEDRRPFRT